MDYSAMDFWWKVAITLLNLTIGIYLFWERHSDATKRRIDDLEEDVDRRMDDYSSRLAKVEERIENLPNHEDLGELHKRINGVSSDVKTMTGELTGIKTTLNLIHEYLLKGGRT